MKSLRSHIFKIWVIGLICTGLIAAVAEPADASRSNEEFANWLESLTKKAHTPKLEQKLNSLKKANVGLHRLIEEASRIVNENNEDFNLPLNALSGNIQHILLVEWNQYQSGSSMAAIPSVETAKTYLVPQAQKSVFADADWFSTPESDSSCQCANRLFTISTEGTNYFITPLVSGIAIGAP